QDRRAAGRGAETPSRAGGAARTVAGPAVARPAVSQARRSQAGCAPPRPGAVKPAPARRDVAPLRRGPTTTSPHRGVAPLRPGTSSVEFGGFGGRDTPANSTLEAAQTRCGATLEAAPEATRHHTRPGTTLDPAPDATRHHTRPGTRRNAPPHSRRRPVSLRGGQLTSGRVSLGRPEVLEAQVVDGQVRLAPAAELLDADPRGIGRLGGGELQADPLRLAGLWE